MVLNEAVNDLGKFWIIKCMDAFTAVTRGRCKQLQAERFGQASECNFRGPYGVGASNPGFAHLQTKAVNDHALTHPVATGGGEHAKDDELVTG